MTKPRKEDRRIQRTRTALRTALFELIVRDGYPNVSIQDIADHADIARTTFYLHYKDKDQLLFNSLRDLYNELLEQIPVPGVEELRSGRFSTLSTTTEYEHLTAYADFYRVMMGEDGSPMFAAEVRQLLADAYETRWLRPLVAEGLQPRLPLDLIAFLLAGVKISVMVWWVNHNLQPGPEAMQHIAERFSMNGLLWALGLDSEHEGEVLQSINLPASLGMQM